MRISYTLKTAPPRTDIIITRGGARETAKYIELKGAGRAAVITDKNVSGLYASQIASSLKEAGLEVYIYAFEPGEASKNMHTMIFSAPLA